MAPTAAMLILCHHGKSTSPASLPSPVPLPPATSFGLNLISALKQFSLEKVICKARPDDKQEHGVVTVDPSSASENDLAEALQLSCW
ncbi:hypothetical protein I3760_05G026600 [Carya illinoinensis]|nr:hypothetical protein I3760_05G026600 [Carya illinoinensis]